MSTEKPESAFCRMRSFQADFPAALALGSQACVETSPRERSLFQKITLSHGVLSIHASRLGGTRKETNFLPCLEEKGGFKRVRETISQWGRWSGEKPSPLGILDDTLSLPQSTCTGLTARRAPACWQGAGPSCRPVQRQLPSRSPGVMMLKIVSWPRRLRCFGVIPCLPREC